MKRLASAVLGLALAIACGGGNDGSGGSADPGRTLRFADIPKSLFLRVFHSARFGAAGAAKELGNVEIIWNAPASADQLKQKEILESFITQRVDGIAISALNGDFLTDTINRAIDSGIPVVTWDSDAPNSKRHAFYGVDDYESGRIMAAQAIKLLDGKGRVAVLTSLGATNLQRRLDGVRDGLKDAPGISIVEVYDIKEDPVRVPQIISTASRRYPDPVHLRVEEPQCVFLRGIETMYLPIAHAEGKFVARDGEVLKTLTDRDQLVLRYTDPANPSRDASQGRQVVQFEQARIPRLLIEA